MISFSWALSLLQPSILFAASQLPTIIYSINSKFEQAKQLTVTQAICIVVLCEQMLRGPSGACYGMLAFDVALHCALEMTTQQSFWVNYYALCICMLLVSLHFFGAAVLARTAIGALLGVFLTLDTGSPFLLRWLYQEFTATSNAIDLPWQKNGG